MKGNPLNLHWVLGANRIYLVLMADYVHLHRHSYCGISYELDHSASANCEIPRHQHRLMGYRLGAPFSMREFHRSSHRPYSLRYL
jgi:hypothetical protein